MHHPTALVRITLMVCLGLALATTSSARGQLDNPVYVNDSPRAWELFQRAQDQAADNVGEAVRLYQELLDEYSLKVLPRYSTDDQQQWITVRLRVLKELRDHEELLARYRLIESAAADRMLNDGDLQALAITRSLTQAGLTAMMRLAQAGLEAGHFDASVRWLAEAGRHPDLLGETAAHYWYMSGLAGKYLSELDRTNEAIARLREIAEPVAIELGEALTAIRDQPLAPGEPRNVTSFDRGRADNIHELVGEPIWSAIMQNSLIFRTYGDPMLLDEKRSSNRQEEFREARYLTAVPTVVGPIVYINEGHVISAWDRYTNQRLWRTVRTAAGPDSDREPVGDCNTVAVDNDRLVTYTGHAYNHSRSMRGRRVVCLRTSDGAELWEVRLDRLGEGDEFEGLYPCGSPIMVDGLLYVQARRVSKQYLTSCYVLALDPYDEGRLVWMQHIASSGGLKTGTSRPYSAMTYDAGALYIATSIGAIARIDAPTGQVDWLRRYVSPIDMYRTGRKPWEIHMPAVTDEHVIAIQPDNRAIVVIDKETGDQVHFFPIGPTTAWGGEPRYFLTNGDYVYAIGRRDIRAFLVDVLDQPVWDTSGKGGDHIMMRGRVQLLDDALLVPTENHMLLLDAHTGVKQQELELDVTGNPVAAGNQLIIAGSDTLAAYMPFEEAENMLRQRLVRTPSDAGSALSLVRLGIRRDNLSLALEAATLAQAAVSMAPDSDRAAQQQADLFNLLLEVDEQRLAKTIEEGDRLHDVIGLVAAEPAQYIQHLLAKGNWLAGHDLFRSIEAFQSILTNEELARTPLTNQGVTRDASSWAVQHIVALMDEYGATVYRPQAEFAANQLANMQDEATPTALAELAMQYPLAPAAIDATIMAADEYLTRGLESEALAVLTRVARMVDQGEPAGRVYGRLVELCASTGRIDQAIDLLRHVEYRFGDIRLARADGPRSMSAWLAELGDLGSNAPAVGSFQVDGVVKLRGKLVPQLRDAGPFSSQHLLMIEDEDVTLYSTSDMKPVWSKYVMDDAQLLRLDDDGALLWLPGEEDDLSQTAARLDIDTGQIVWESRRFGEYFGALFTPRGGRSTDGFNPKQVLPLASRDRLVCVRREGQVVSMDLSDAEADIHTRATPLARIYHAALHDYGLVLAGMEKIAAAPGSVHSQLAPAIFVLDPRTLATIHRIEPQDDLPVKWIVTDALGGLVYGTSDGIAMVELLSGETKWRHAAPWISGFGRAWAVQDHVIFEDDDRQLRSVHLRDGRMTSPFELRHLNQWDPATLVHLKVRDGQMYAHYRKRIVRYALPDEFKAADAVADERNYRWLLPSRDGFVVVSLAPPDRMAVGAGRHRYVFYRLSADCRLMEEAELPPAPEAVDSARLVDNWLVLSSRNAAMAIPMPAPAH